MRKHLKNKRLENLIQVGSDRILDLQFGTGEVAYHVILELYDRGNIILTDFELTILYVLRPHTEGDKIKFAVREKYPTSRARESTLPSIDDIKQVLQNAKEGDPLKKVLMPMLEYGPALIEHVFLLNGLKTSAKIGKDFKIDADLDKLYQAILQAEDIMNKAKQYSSQGYIIQKQEERPNTENINEKEYFYSNQEFHPLLYEQHKNMPYKQFESFNQAADEFYSAFEGQKIEMRALQQERDAVKKLENVKKDHSKRIEDLEKTQLEDKQKAELITRNQELVEKAIFAVQTALANQISWADLTNLVKDATANGDPVAKHIKKLKLETNHISLLLSDPYEENELPTILIDIDLSLSAFSNARKYYDLKRNAAKKQQKTIESQSKAFKSAEKKTKQTLKEVQTITNINKARKVYWFEKFFWFISSENYLVIAGRDQQQNELIVKRYMKSNDIYVHADIHGASSVVIKNPSGLPVPPKTLNEAGVMAICYSVAWEAKVVTNAYWVLGEQVTKTAPTGEYLTTGSFMIRGKKNFLPPSHLILGLSFLFRLEDGSIERHKGERKVVYGNDDTISITESDAGKDEVEIEVVDKSDDEEDAENQLEELDNRLETLPELNMEGISNLKNDNIEEDGKENEDSEEESLKSNSDEYDQEESKFPDTQIKIQHFEGTKINVLTEPTQTNNKEEDTETIVYLGDNNPVVLKPRSRVNSENKQKQLKPLSKKSESKEDIKTPQQQIKRGQKSKMRKIKEKYKDQDDEERQLRMTILQSAGTAKDTKKKKAKEINTKSVKKGGQQNKPYKQHIQKQEVQDDGTVDDDEPNVQAEVDMIDALTGIPVSEDELLFAVPVVAPYNTLINYKFKIKLTPGTSRRGKAAKTAVNMFIHDRTITQRERDLLKAVKDEQLARNIPGKVKLSAPRTQAFKR
ncbi:nuclear export mediator factor nemf [Holotrichia oblita]|uniref:Nuclear export mediator factor nemf n=1 Tax=Holotrichia oblita TaxID=644536 RepID=A0ACB9TLM0_HOLOL|nr:nuclear export mediator factor nemf [Holotrichia oblita]